MRAATLRLQRKYTSAINKGFPLWLKVWAVSLPFVRSETYSQLVHQIYSITKIYVSNTLILLSLVGSPTREPAAQPILYIYMYIYMVRVLAQGAGLGVSDPAVLFKRSIRIVIAHVVLVFITRPIDVCQKPIRRWRKD